MSGISFKKDDTQKTYGEKMYSRIFDVGINFGLNLAASAAFTYWVKHSTKPVWANKGTGKFHEALNQTPSAFYQQLVGNITHAPFMQAFERYGVAGKRNVAEAMANIITLNMAGHAIVIPSVWLGEKYKANIVKHFDHAHYQKNGQPLPEWVEERHKSIEQSPKTSVAGAVGVRIGTMLATTTTAYAIGARNNFIKMAGEKFNIGVLEKYHGLDHISSALGNKTGKAIEGLLPKKTLSNINGAARKAGFSFSPEQTKKILGKNSPLTAKEIDRLRLGGHVSNTPYNNVISDLTGFTFLDTLYTIVTAASIDPLLKQIKKLPGMTYTQDKEQEKPKNTLGGRVHGAITYGGVDWLLNAAIGASFAFIATRTPFGKKTYGEGLNKLLTSAFKPLVKEAQLKKSVEGATDLISITVGGMAINPILTRIEKPENKKAIVKSIDQLLYGKEEVEKNPKFQRAYDEIEKQPEKSIGAAWVSRFITLAPLLYVSAQPKLLGFFQENLGFMSINTIARKSQRLFEKVGIKPTSAFWTEKIDSAGEVIKAGAAGGKTRWETLHHLIGFDFGMTIYYAGLHAFTFPIVSNVMDKFGKKGKKDKKPHEKPHTEAKALAAAPHDIEPPALPAPETPTDTPDIPRSELLKISEISRLVPEGALNVAQ